MHEIFKNMNIVDKPIDEIIPYVNNPRNNQAAVDAVASSIAEFGFNVPVVVDKNNVLVTGHTRVLAAKKLGMTTVPCIRADHLTDAMAKAYRIADNKVAELATWNTDLLQAELDELKELNFDMTEFGFDEDELNALDDVQEDEVPEIDEESEPTTQLGDLFQLGEHRLLCGDSTSVEDVARLTAGAGHYFCDKRTESTVIEDRVNLEKMDKAELKALCRELMNRQPFETTILREDKPLSNDIHPTMKPVKLFARLILNSSQKGENVLDLFGGSGTTMMACEQLGRKAFLMELDPRYCDAIIKRFEQTTGKKAVKL